MINLIKETFYIIKSVTSGIGEYFFIKVFPSIVVPAIGFLFGFENNQILAALFTLIIFDFITGIFAAKVSGEKIKSRTAIRSAYKVAIYGLLMSAGHLTESIVPGTIFIQETITSFLGLTEMISIVENAGKMGFAVPQKLLNQLQKWRDSDPTIPDLPPNVPPTNI